MAVRRPVAGLSILQNGLRNRRWAFAFWAYLLWERLSRRHYGQRRKDAFPISRQSNIRRLKPIVQPRMGPDNLRLAFSDALKETRGDHFGASFILAHTIVRVFMGDEWVKKYVNHTTVKKPSIFTQRDLPLLDRHKAITNYTRLAENLYNLQDISGFYECVDRLRSGDIDGAFAELEFGGMLRRNRLSFRYVVPSGTIGNDYDIDILHPSGIIICADAKCKVESTAFRRSTVESTLGRARKQFPKDRPCMVFIKIPSSWMEAPNWKQELGDELLRERRRILSVTYYAIHWVMGAGHVTVRLGYSEVSNETTDFGNNIDWRMFHQEWSGRAPWWQPIVYYPDGRAR
jgi:hypothetical protein